MLYIDAIKNLNKKYYLTPFLIFTYAIILYQLWEPVYDFITYVYEGPLDIVSFLISVLYVHLLFIIQIFFYPHASYSIQATWIYRKLFRSPWGSLKNGFFTYTSIGNNIPDDFHIRSAKGNRYTVSASYKSKSARVSEARALYLIFLFMKIFMKDIALRLFTHLGVLAISPLLFLIAIPILKKKDLLANIEK